MKFTLGFETGKHKKKEEVANSLRSIGGSGLSLIDGASSDALTKTVLSDYENAFAPVSAIVDEIIKRNVHLASPSNPENDISSSQALWYALTHPNDRMGFHSFLGVMVAGFLVLPELSLLLFHKGADGKPKAGMPEGGFSINTIYGFVVLPRWCKSRQADGTEQWQVKIAGEQRTFLRKDVITLKYSTLPDDGITGVSPGSSSKQEAAIRDGLNQYERAFFANGAKPSTIVTIYAPSKQEADAIKQSYEMANRGAANSNGTLYQTVIEGGMNSGAPQPHIEVTPVGGVNNTLSISEIVGFTSDTINANYGISPAMFGNTTDLNYQNRKIVESQFKDRVQAICVRLFGELERELQRITNTPTLPFVFAWDNPETEIVDEEKVKADTLVSITTAITNLMKLGADSDAAVKALGLDEAWEGLNLTAPAPTQTFSMNSFPQLPQAPVENARPKSVKTRQPEAVTLVRDLLVDISEHRMDYKLGRVDNSIMPSEQEYVQELVDVLRELADRGGVTTARQLANELTGYRVGRDYVMSDEAFSFISKRANKVISDYSNFIDEQIALAVEKDPSNWAAIYEESMQQGTVGSRINAISTMETKNAFQSGQLDNATRINREYQMENPNAYIVKNWLATGANPCEFCAGMDGREAGIEDTFVPGGIIHTEDSSLILDDGYTDGTTPDAHVNCECTFGFKVVER